MKRNHAFNESDINFSSEKIKKLSESIEDKKLKEKLGKAIDTLSEVKKKFSTNSLENKLHRKYKCFGGDLEEYFDLEDIDMPVDIRSADPDPEALFVSWCETWILYRYLLDMLALYSTL